MSKRAFYNGDVDGILLPAIDATVFVETDSDSRCGHVERFTLTELSFGFENTPNKIHAFIHSQTIYRFCLMGQRHKIFDPRVNSMILSHPWAPYSDAKVFSRSYFQAQRTPRCHWHSAASLALCYSYDIIFSSAAFKGTLKILTLSNFYSSITRVYPFY